MCSKSLWTLFHSPLGPTSSCVEAKWPSSGLAGVPREMCYQEGIYWTFSQIGDLFGKTKAMDPQCH